MRFKRDREFEQGLFANSPFGEKSEPNDWVKRSGPITNEYAEIRDAITRLEHARINNAQSGLTDQIRQTIREELAQGTVAEQVRKVVREELAQGAVTEQMRKVVRDEQYRWLGSAVSLLAAVGGVGISVATSESAVRILDSHGDWLGPAITVVALIVMWLLLGRR